MNSVCNTPQIQLTLSAELRNVIHERNILTTRTRMKVLSALDDVNQNCIDDRRNTLRSKAVQEILTSEVSYLHQLELIMTHFMKPLKERKLVNHATYTSLFGNIETIYNVNGELLKELKDNPENIASAFLKLAPFFKLYSVYAYDYKQILMVLEDTVKTNLELNNFIAGQESRPEVGTKLLSLLITPIQRVPRYRLLLREVLSHTPTTHKDYLVLQESLQEVEKAAEHINRLMQDQENMQKMINLQRSLFRSKPKIVKPGRKLIKEGMLMKVSPQGRKAHPRYFLLFSDMLMYCKVLRPNTAEANSLRCCCILPLKDCTVDEILCKDMFKLSCHTETLILYSATNEEGEKWVKALKDALKQFHECRQTLRKDSSSRRPMRPPEFLNSLKLDDFTSRASRKRKRLRKELEDIYQCDETDATSYKKCSSKFKKLQIAGKSPWKKIKLTCFNKNAAAGSGRALPGEPKDSLYPLRSSLRKAGNILPPPPRFQDPIGLTEVKDRGTETYATNQKSGQTNLAFDLIECQTSLSLAEIDGQSRPHAGGGGTSPEPGFWHPFHFDKIKLFLTDFGRSVSKRLLRNSSTDPMDAT